MKTCYLRIGADDITEAQRCISVAAAKREFGRVARDLARFGQAIEGTIHIADSRWDVAEYPDFVLRLSDSGGVICETT